MVRSALLTLSTFHFLLSTFHFPLFTFHSGGGGTPLAKVFYDADADMAQLARRKVAVLGFGSQGHAHALNLRDSGVEVMMGLRPGKSWDAATAAGLPVFTVDEATRRADIIMILVNDEYQASLYKEMIEPNLRAGKTLAFAHGFNIHFHQIVPPTDVDVFMVAPKGPGHLVRRVFTEGKGVPCLMAIFQDASGSARDVALAYARGIGGTRAGVLETTLPGGDGDRPLRRAGASSAAGRPRSSRPPSRRSWKPAMRRRSPTSSACTS